jgi:beta-glucosidase
LTPLQQNKSYPINERIDMPSKLLNDTDINLEEQISDLIGKMTLEEKIGQMTQVEKKSICPEDVGKFFIGSVLSGGGGYPTNNSPSSWVQMVNSYQKYAMETRLAIPLIYGVDAVHGHNNCYGAVIFPHNIGLGATGDPDLVFQIGKATAEELVATGIYWNFAPTVAVPQDIRWGRTYEGFSENPELVSTLGTAYTRGLQGERLDLPFSVLATPKHYLGDGGTSWKSSRERNYLLDQGDARIDEATLRRIHLSPYISAIKQGALCIMASYSSWNGNKLTGDYYLLTKVLKDELGFKGFIVTDWQAIDQLSADYYQSVVLGMNAGIDMNMVPYDYKRFITTIHQAVQQGDVAISRIDDAVSRILYVKFILGLFRRPFAQPDFLQMVGSNSHRELARQVVSQSLVLLKNEFQTLPVSRNLETILVAGNGADNLGIQCGGWTIEWIGLDGNKMPGTTILDGIRIRYLIIPVSISIHPAFDEHDDTVVNRTISDLGVVVVGSPYAEGVGDADLHTLSGGYRIDYAHA